MPNEISNAIGTQRQFMSQPKGVYQKQLQQPSFGAGISNGANLDAQQLAGALGVLGQNLERETAAEDKRAREQLTDEDAQRMIAGKTPEDLAKFDRVVGLQHADVGFDVTDNPYAMAALERAIGQVAAAQAKSTYHTNNAGLPESEQAAVKAFEETSKETYKQFEGSIKNKTAFDRGFKSTMFDDTLKIAEKARTDIADYTRGKGQRVIGVKMGNAFANAHLLDTPAFIEKMTPILSELQMYCKTPEEAIKVIEANLGDFAMNATSTEKLKALGKLPFFGKSTIGEEIPMSKHYKQIAKNANKGIMEKIKAATKRPDDTYNESTADQMIKEASGGGTVGHPRFDLQVSRGDNPDITNINPELKGAMPLIGGILFNAGHADAEITSGYRDVARNVAAGGVENSNHLSGNAVDIWVGDMDATEQEHVTGLFKDYFGEVLYHEVEGGQLHLHLGDYKGGLEEGEVDDTASIYDPDRETELRTIFKSAQSEAKAVKAQAYEDKKEAVMESVYTAGSLEESYRILNNSGLKFSDRLTMQKALDAKAKKSASAEGKSPEYKMWSSYESSKTGLFADLALAKEYQAKLLDSSAVILDEDQKKYNKAAAMLTAYYNYSSNGVSSLSTEGTEPPKAEEDIEEEAATPKRDAEADTAAIVEMAQASLDNGSSKEQVIRSVRKDAEKSGLDVRTVLQQIKWN